MKFNKSIIAAGISAGSFAAGVITDNLITKRAVKIFEEQKSDIRRVSRSKNILNLISKIPDEDIRTMQTYNYMSLLTTAALASDMNDLNQCKSDLNTFFDCLKEIVEHGVDNDDDVEDIKPVDIHTDDVQEDDTKEVNTASSELAELVDKLLAGGFDTEYELPATALLRRHVNMGEAIQLIMRKFILAFADNNCTEDEKFVTITNIFRYYVMVSLVSKESSDISDADDEMLNAVFTIVWYDNSEELTSNAYDIYKKHGKTLEDLEKKIKNTSIRMLYTFTMLRAQINTTTDEYDLDFRMDMMSKNVEDALAMCEDYRKYQEIVKDIEEGRISYGSNRTADSSDNDDSTKEDPEDIQEAVVENEQCVRTEDESVSEESTVDSQESVPEEVSINLDELIGALVDRFGKRYKEQIQNTIYMLDSEKDETIKESFFTQFVDLIGPEREVISDKDTDEQMLTDLIARYNAQ